MMINFYFITAVTLWRSLHHYSASDGGAEPIATIPLDSFSGDAAVIGVFSLWGLSQLIVGLMWGDPVSLQVTHPAHVCTSRRGIHWPAAYGSFRPIPAAGTAPGGVVTLPMILIGNLMLVLSICERKALKENSELEEQQLTETSALRILSIFLEKSIYKNNGRYNRIMADILKK